MNKQVEKMLEYNQLFVDHKMYLRYTTSKYPDRKIAILSCMDTRMTELLPAALGFKNGDVKMIKNAGGRVLHPYGSVIFSLLVAIYELDVDTILVIGHEDCGAGTLNGQKMIDSMLRKGVCAEVIERVNQNHKDLNKWISGFDDIYETVQDTVDIIRKHPLIHADIEIHGFVMNPETGAVYPAETRPPCEKEEATSL